jgi:hypothetical protein
MEYRGARSVAGLPGARSPERFGLVASRLSDTVRLEVDVRDALATGMGGGGLRRAFLQMRGDFHVTGKVDGVAIADSGAGFFETYVRR